MEHQYKRRGLRALSEQKFTRLCEISYGAVGEANERKWEMVQRTTRAIPFETFSTSPAPIPVDAVELCAILERANEKYLVLVAQYRPPLDAVVLEFPAGLVDCGETPEMAALRELREETGLIAEERSILSVSPAICPEPGLSDTCCLFVRIAVDGTIPENVTPKQQLDSGEDIEVVLLRIDQRSEALVNLEALLQERNAGGCRTIADAKLYTFLYGLSS